MRLVWRVKDMAVPVWPGLAVDACSRCFQPVYVDTTQVFPSAADVTVLVCVPCGLADPRLRPEILRTYAAVQAAASWAGNDGTY